MRFDNQVHINAPVDLVWQLTEDVEKWPSITPTMSTVELIGEEPLRVGSQAHVEQPGRRRAVWTVTRLEPPHVFEWETRTMGATMTARHEFAEADGGCQSTLVIELSGLGARLIGLLGGRKIREAIATENSAFKRHAEAASRADG